MLWESIDLIKNKDITLQSNDVNALSWNPSDSSLYIGTQNGVAKRDKLGHWQKIDAAGCTEVLGDILPMERGDYRWRITVPADGSLPGDGLVPTLIQWDVPFHPAGRLPDVGCRLMKLEGFHPHPARIGNALAALGLSARLDVHRCAAGEPAQLVAYLRTPAGLKELD